MKLVKRGNEIWLQDDEYFIRNPITGEERPRVKCDREISIEDALTMYREKLNSIRGALGMSARDTSYSLDIESRARNAVDAENRLKGLYASYVVTSAWGTVLVAADCLAEYLAELREEGGDSCIDIRKLQGHITEGEDRSWA